MSASFNLPILCREWRSTRAIYRAILRVRGRYSQATFHVGSAPHPFIRGDQDALSNNRSHRQRHRSWRRDCANSAGASRSRADRDRGDQAPDRERQTRALQGGERHDRAGRKERNYDGGRRALSDVGIDRGLGWRRDQDAGRGRGHFHRCGQIGVACREGQRAVNLNSFHACPQRVQRRRRRHRRAPGSCIVQLDLFPT